MREKTQPISNMGTTQSKTSVERHAEIGPFLLDSKQKASITILNKIVQQLLTKNNLYDLKELLSDETQCGKLFVIVSTTVQKEFQLLKFPDPRNPSHMATLSFLPSESYPPQYPDSEVARTTACNFITHFLIRLITLAAACTASITRNPNVAELLDIAKIATPTDDINKSIRSLPSDLNFSNAPVSTDVLKYLESVFLPVSTSKRPNLYRYKTTHTYIIDAKRSVIYNSSGSFDEGRTPVFKITMDLLKDQRAVSDIAVPASSSYGASGSIAPSSSGSSASGASTASNTTQAPPAATAAAAAAGTAGAAGAAQAANTGQLNPNNRMKIENPANITAAGIARPGSIASSNAQSAARSALGARGGRFKSRRGRQQRKKQTRRRSRFHGGGEKVSYVKVVLEEVPYFKYTDCENKSICKKLVFIMDNNGNTFDEVQYSTFQREPIRPISAIDFIERIVPFFDTIREHRVMTEEYHERTDLDKDRFKALSGSKTETLKTLEDYRDTLSALKTGAAPAPYRAFLLASRYANGSLSTFFCQDEWTNQYMVATLSYSLLQALYDDGIAGTTSSPRSLDTCKAAAKTFIGAMVAAPAAQSGSDVENFRNLKFTSTPDALAEFCKTSAPQQTEKKDEQTILINAQREIRLLYDNHVRDMLGVMRKVLFITSDPSTPGSLILNLNEAFSKSPDGAIVVLERIIEEARNLIAKHFLEVEKVYISALVSIGRGYRGINNSKTRAEMTSANKLEQISTLASPN